MGGDELGASREAETTLRALIARWRERGRTYRQFKDPGRNYDFLAAANLHADELEAVLVAEASARPAPPPQPIMVDRDADLRRELRVWLDAQTITSDNIGDIRRSLFMPWDSPWNGWVRDETAERENAKPAPPPSTTPQKDALTKEPLFEDVLRRQKGGATTADKLRWVFNADLEVSSGGGTLESRADGLMTEVRYLIDDIYQKWQAAEARLTTPRNDEEQP